MNSDRTFDIVVFGATGFTGRLVAEYLARKNRETGFRWAIAGRNPARLAEVKARIEAIHPGAAVSVIEASASDPDSLDRMARSARVVLTTVGPYADHGEPLVAACVREGADYVDITGEPQFVGALIARYDAEARARGVRIVNCCGFDSIPHDLGALFTVRKLPAGEPIVLEGFVRAKGMFSGGTWQSAVGAFGSLRSRGPRQKRAGATTGRKARGIKPRVGYERRLGTWVCPMPTIDPLIVLRSARALEDYGPDFRYGHYIQVQSFASLLALAGGVGAVVALAQLGPTRELLKRMRSSGEGPSAEERARGWFEVTFQGKAASRRVITRVRGGDPGYDETAKMVAESALCLALDRERLPALAGVLTPAVAMGDLLIERLSRAGIQFDVLEAST